MKNNSSVRWPLRLLQIILTLALLAAVLLAIFNIKSGQGQQGRQQLEDSIRRSAMACYTVEGVYPPNVDYLRQHYGLQVDEERYTVYYTVFAENIMPDITVLEKNK